MIADIGGVNRGQKPPCNHAFVALQDLPNTVRLGCFLNYFCERYRSADDGEKRLNLTVLRPDPGLPTDCQHRARAGAMPAPLCWVQTYRKARGFHQNFGKASAIHRDVRRGFA